MARYVVIHDVNYNGWPAAPAYDRVGALCLPYVVCNAHPPTTGCIYVSKSSNEGVTWGAPAKIAAPDTGYFWQTVAMVKKVLSNGTWRFFVYLSKNTSGVFTTYYCKTDDTGSGAFGTVSSPALLSASPWAPFGSGLVLASGRVIVPCQSNDTSWNIGIIITDDDGANHTIVTVAASTAQMCGEDKIGRAHV